MLSRSILFILSRRLFVESISDEAYATLIYNGRTGRESKRIRMYVCSAAILGKELRLADHRRDRVALISGLSLDAEAVVSATWNRLQRIDAFEELRLRKHALWKLPYRRVLFIDADVILPHSDNAILQAARTERLQRLWRIATSEEEDHILLRAFAVKSKAQQDVRALGNKHRRAECFNSGFLLLRPSPAMYSGLLEESVKKSASTIVCPGHDQKSLNSAFYRKWKPIPLSSFVLFRLSNATRRQLYHVVHRIESGRIKFDAYHLYFSTSVSKYVNNAKPQVRCDRHGHYATLREAAEQALLRAWHNSTKRLPSSTNQFCTSLLPQSTRCTSPPLNQADAARSLPSRNILRHTAP